MRSSFLAVLFAATSVTQADPQLVEVASFPDQQVTGVTVSSKGRIFVNFPFWDERHTLSVAELKDGKPQSFPDGRWNSKEGDAATRFVCVQSVVCDKGDHLLVVDTGSPMQQGVIANGAKLVEIDLTTDKVVRTFPMGPDVAPAASYLNDIRIDRENQSAYLTESGEGSLIVVDLSSGRARRLLENHPSTHAEPSKVLVVGDEKPVDPKTGGTPRFHADGIALDEQGGWLYYHALTGDTLYRVPTAALRNPALSPEALAAKVEKVAVTSSPDGMIEDNQGGIYLAAFEKSAVTRFDIAAGKETLIVRDDRLKWPDTFSWGPDGWLYVTTSQIHLMPKYNRGENKRIEPFRVYKVKSGN
ncbi:SMP-30/gluconolactonase/LRE family protein [Luteolibacter ambystomatis]|uniref:SMP-30/gluconolactonase/LRE family protein n=1 Tax=Luteolibacter ambystomatis TaxID=2824561 RepID=A0A975J3A5_9BACT|nr:L-dopachrome tautomerase-related protein [Luteolibacter ambystomatis]QUE53209.1 SMP-30/gluconolactonase/LRE family protein [Luteolibacter ambystomatis]